MKKEVKERVQRYFDLIKWSYNDALNSIDLIRYELMEQLIRTPVIRIDFSKTTNGSLKFYVLSSEKFLVDIEITPESNIKIKG